MPPRVNTGDCLVVASCPLIGRLVLSFVIGRLDRCSRLRTHAQVERRVELA